MLHHPRSNTDIGQGYLDTLSETDRRATGRIYTPLSLVRFILDAVQYTEGTSIEAVSLLDPACGAGVFLEEALRRLASRVAIVQGDLRFSKASETFLDAARRNLIGVDTDPEACRLARQALARTASDVTGRQVGVEHFAANIIEADFLSDEILRPGGRLSVFPSFSAVVGNPPYVAATRLSAAAKDALRRQFETASGRIDLYILFFERGISLLHPGGRLAYVTPDKFLSSQSARPLRRLLRERGAVRTLARFNSHKIFHGAATVPCVTLFERGAQQAQVELIRCERDTTMLGRITVVSRARLPASMVACDDWAAVHPDIQRVAVKIRGLHPKLNAVTHRVSAGLATGRDGIFVFRADADHGIEPQLLHPVIRGRDIAPFRIDSPQLRILLPYVFDRRVPKLVDLRGYPGARRYLAAHRRELEARHCVTKWGKAWYDLHDPVPSDLSTMPKVVVPDIADRNRFAFDPGAYVPLHSAYYLVPEGPDGRFLTALLNSRPIEFLVRTTAPRVKDGYSRYRSQFLLSLPVPSTPPRAVASIIRAHDRGDFAEATDIATTLFGLTRGDHAVISAALEDSKASV
jgi:adenine-specific DNA-methyltransferase